MRIAAFRALRRINHRVLEHARMLATDSSPAVRREVALALRDTAFDTARELLLTLARGYDGNDRAYLEAWGTGCTGKEPQVYAARAAAAALPERERISAITALGFIPTRASANALLDLAQKSSGMVKAHAMWWLMNYKDIHWKDAGINAALKARGLYDPDTVSITPSIVPEPEPTKLPSAAAIAKLQGDATKGAATAQACLLCHRIGDKGNEYGPALSGFAQAQTTEVVINAIINPSAEIAHGYDGVQINLRDGGQVHGILLSGGDPIVIQSMGGLTQMIPASKVRGGARQQLGRSLMLSADQLGLSAQDVADVVAHLKTQ